MKSERLLVEAAIDKHVTSDEHVAFRALVDEINQKKKRWDTITTSVLGALIIGVLYWVGSHVIEIASWIIRNFK